MKESPEQSFAVDDAVMRLIASIVGYTASVACLGFVSMLIPWWALIVATVIMAVAILACTRWLREALDECYWRGRNEEASRSSDELKRFARSINEPPYHRSN